MSGISMQIYQLALSGMILIMTLVRVVVRDNDSMKLKDMWFQLHVKIAFQPRMPSYATYASRVCHVCLTFEI